MLCGCRGRSTVELRRRCRLHRLPDKAERVLNAALKDLESQPMLGYSGTIYDFNGSADTTDIEIDASSSGVAHGTAKLGDKKS